MFIILIEAHAFDQTQAPEWIGLSQETSFSSYLDTVFRLTKLSTHHPVYVNDNLKHPPCGFPSMIHLIQL